jgi:hypothetical protein
MVFDVSAGLSQMGESVGRVAGLAALEQQKSGLEAEKIRLASDLAGERESKGRQETAALQSKENVRHEGFQATENELNRKAQLEAHRISADSAAATANAHLKGIQMQIDHAERQGDVKIGEDGAGLLINRATGKSTPLLDDKGAPLKFSNPEKAKAQAELIQLTRDQMTATTRQYEIEYRQASTELTTAMKSPGAMLDPQKDPGVLEAKKRLEEIQKKYEPQIKLFQQRASQLSEALTGKTNLTAPAPAGKSLSDFDRSRAPSAPTAPSSGGLINSDEYP